MVLADAGLVLAGLVLVFFGAALSVYAVALLGFLIGAGGAYVVVPSVLGAVGSGGLVGLAVAVVVGGLLGAALAYVALSFATSVPSFVVGAYLGLYVLTPLFTEGGLVRYLFAALGGVLGAVLGFTLTKFALMFVTSFVGAALASRSLTPAAFRAAREGPVLEPLLFDPLATTAVLVAEVPPFGALFVLGLLSQLGLFRLGWVARLAAVLPGVGRVVDDGG
jgi:large-conductance mechanosensitive channel